MEFRHLGRVAWLIHLCRQAFLRQGDEENRHGPVGYSTFLTVTVIWVFFRIENFGMAWTFVTRLFAFDFSGFAFAGNAHVYTILVVAAVFSFLTLTGWGKKLEQKVYYTDFTDRQHIWVWIVAAFAFVFCVAALNASSFSPFIYFRF